MNQLFSAHQPVTEGLSRVAPAATPIIRVAVFGQAPGVATILEELARRHGNCRPVRIRGPAAAAPMEDYDVALLAPDGDGAETAEDLLADAAHLRKHCLGCAALTRGALPFEEDALVVCLPPTIGVDALYGTLLALARCRPMLLRIDGELNWMRVIGKRFQHHFEEIDQELRLAARLQRDFLPREFPRVGPLRFGSIFRPCRWVSGDIFDVFRLDEHHVGLYLADAVGHGVAAGLLTMFLKHAIRPKHIHGRRYELIAPSEVLRRLNVHLLAQHLPESQFVTAAYGMIDTRTLEFRYALAGHPRPLLIEATGSYRELVGDGCLLGVFADQTFGEDRVSLAPGQRVLLYSDGLEETLVAERVPNNGPMTLRPGMAGMLRQPLDALMAALNATLDEAPGGLTRADDVSAVVVEVVAEAEC